MASQLSAPTATHSHPLCNIIQAAIDAELCENKSANWPRGPAVRCMSCPRTAKDYLFKTSTTLSAGVILPNDWIFCTDMCAKSLCDALALRLKQKKNGVVVNKITKQVAYQQSSRKSVVPSTAPKRSVERKPSGKVPTPSRSPIVKSTSHQTSNGRERATNLQVPHTISRSQSANGGYRQPAHFSVDYHVRRARSDSPLLSNDRDRGNQLPILLNDAFMPAMLLRQDSL